MSRESWGVLCGLAVALGLLMVASWAGSRRRPGIRDRIAPHVGGASTQVRGHAALPGWASLAELVRTGGAGWTGASRGLPRASSRTVQTAGMPGAPRSSRLDQLAWVAVGGCAGGIAGLVLSVGGASPLSTVVLASFGGVVGWLVRDRRMVRQQRRRRDRIDEQLPSLAELLAFAVAAGESPIAAMDRAGSTMGGPLADEVRLSVSHVQSGVALESALRAMSSRVGSVPLDRFVDGLVVSLERGTPLAEVLRAQAADARAGQRRELMEKAGRKDVAMLVPVVFLVLPTVVLVAMFPGIQGLHLIVP